MQHCPALTQCVFVFRSERCIAGVFLVELRAGSCPGQLLGLQAKADVSTPLCSSALLRAWAEQARLCSGHWCHAHLPVEVTIVTQSFYFFFFQSSPKSHREDSIMSCATLWLRCRKLQKRSTPVVTSFLRLFILH